MKRKNRGIFYTRIEGIKKATAEYIYFLDADDWIEKNTIEVMYQYRKQYNSSIVRCKNYYKDENEKVQSNDEIVYLEKKDFNDKLYSNLFGTYDFASIWNQLIQKKYFEDLEDIDYSVNYGEDYWINLKIYKNIDSLLLVPDYLYHYRTNDTSITNQQNYEGLLKKLKSVYKSHFKIVNMIDQYPNVEEKEKYKKIAIYRAVRGIKNRVIEFASFGIREGKKEEVYQEIKKLLKQEEFDQMRYKIELGELLKLSKQENHKYVIKNIYQGNVEKILKYVKRIYLPGKKIKKLIRR